MTYLVNDNCIKCKHMDCVEVCPVDCFYAGENMLVINPDVFYELNYKWSNTWPNITSKDESEVPADAEEWANVKDKMKYFSEKPGAGD